MSYGRYGRYGGYGKYETRKLHQKWNAEHTFRTIAAVTGLLLASIAWYLVFFGFGRVRNIVESVGHLVAWSAGMMLCAAASHFIARAIATAHWLRLVMFFASVFVTVVAFGFFYVLIVTAGFGALFVSH